MDFLHKNLKAIRLRWGDNQEEFAARFGLKRSNYAKIEVGDYAVSIEMLMKLSDMTGISANDLVRKDVLSEKIPHLPNAEGNRRMAENPTQSGEQDLYAEPEYVTVNPVSNWDIQTLAGKVLEMDARYQELTENSVRKKDLWSLVSVLIEHLDSEPNEQDDKAEKEAFVGRLVELGLDSKRIGIWEKYAVVNQLLVAGKKKVAISMATELVETAKKAGLTLMVATLAVLLEEHFGALETDAQRYVKYREMRKEYAKHLKDELHVRALLAKLVFNINNGKGVDGMEGKLEKLSNNNKGSFTFMRYRFTALSVWYEFKGEMVDLISLSRETAKFYEECESEVPISAAVNIYVKIIPILAKAGRFEEAETEISLALKIPIPGSQNWHLLMLQKACIGIQSNKLPMAHSALRMALDAPREHENPDIDRRWQVVEAILKGKAVSDVWKEVLG